MVAILIDKKDIRRIIDELPDDANWEELMYRLRVRYSIEKGLHDSAEGLVKPTTEIRKKFGLAGSE